MLRAGLVRLQLGGPSHYDDRASFQVVNRRMPVPSFHSNITGTALTVTTDATTLRIDGDGTLDITCGGGRHSKRLHPTGGLSNASLAALPSMPVSRVGWYVLDDSTTARLSGTDAATGEMAWWQPSLNGSDVYALCYGADVAEGMRQLTSITGAPPLMPLASYGVWYSGCCIPALYTQQAVSSELLAAYRSRAPPAAPPPPRTRLPSTRFDRREQIRQACHPATHTALSRTHNLT